MSEGSPDDTDNEKVLRALIRASKRSRALAAMTRTEFVVIRDGVLVREIPPIEEAQVLLLEVEELRKKGGSAGSSPPNGPQAWWLA